MSLVSQTINWSVIKFDRRFHREPAVLIIDLPELVCSSMKQKWIENFDIKMRPVKIGSDKFRQVAFWYQNATCLNLSEPILTGRILISKFSIHFCFMLLHTSSGRSIINTAGSRWNRRSNFMTDQFMVWLTRDIYRHQKPPNQTTLDQSHRYSFWLVKVEDSPRFIHNR